MANTSLLPSYHTQPLFIAEACALLLPATSPAQCRGAFQADAGFQERLNSFLASWKLAVFLSFGARRGSQPCASGECRAPSHCVLRRTWGHGPSFALSSGASGRIGSLQASFSSPQGPPSPSSSLAPPSRRREAYDSAASSLVFECCWQGRLASLLFLRRLASSGMEKLIPRHCLWKSCR